MFPENNILSNIGGIFRKKPEPRELVRKWQAMLRKEQRGMDTQIREIQREEKTAQKQVKEAAKRGDMSSARLLAKELVRTRKATTQLYTNKAHMIAMGTQLQEQLAMVKVAGTLSKSTEVMKLVNDMMKSSRLNQTMMELSREMMKAGVIDEMMADAIDGAVDTEDMEAETEEEVDKVRDETFRKLSHSLTRLSVRFDGTVDTEDMAAEIEEEKSWQLVLVEIAGETMSQMTAAPKERQPAAAAAEEVEEPNDLDDDLRARLEAVRS